MRADDIADFIIIGIVVVLVMVGAALIIHQQAQLSQREGYCTALHAKFVDTKDANDYCIRNKQIVREWN
jgi:uncharacterized protein YxeA